MPKFKMVLLLNLPSISDLPAAINPNFSFQVVRTGKNLRYIDQQPAS
jgi:hypothetical protein